MDKRTAELQRRTTDLEKAIMELRDTQQQVIQQERMRALGTMASGIAHDLSNGPLDKLITNPTLLVFLYLNPFSEARRRNSHSGEAQRGVLGQQHGQLDSY